jgi:hypothetical protein
LVKLTTFSRSSVMAIDATMASNLRDCSAGMMPSHSCCTRVHSAFISAHSASAMSMSKPLSLPSGPTSLKGG